MEKTISNVFSRLFAEADLTEILLRFITVILTVFFIFVVFNIFRLVASKLAKGRLGVERIRIMRKGIQYAAWFVAILFVFKSLGIDSSAILGAAGIAGVALGFAAQTSMSNLISGLFLLSEKPCKAGDVITVTGVTGVVLSIDLLSVKLRTFDNLFIRIPNETIIRENLTNITRFPIRRLEIAFTVPYGVDTAAVRVLLLNLAEKNLFCLKNPAPLFCITGLNQNGIDMSIYLWFEKSAFLDLKNSYLEAMLNSFKENGIDFAAMRVMPLDLTHHNGTPPAG